MNRLAVVSLCLASLSLAQCSSGSEGPGTAVDASLPTGTQGPPPTSDGAVALSDGGVDAAKTPVLDAGALDAGALDPTQAGPYAYAELDDSFTSTVDGSSVAVHVAYPTSGPAKGPYPVVLFAHGFLIDPSEYYSYIQRAATYGYVGITVNFPTNTFSANYVANVTDLIGGLNWLDAKTKGTAAPLAGLADMTRIGASGHSLGGKLAILVAAQDARVKASITFDAVDGSNLCAAAGDCPDASSVLPLPIPTAFLGETLDSKTASGIGQSCAPASADYVTLYTPASSPSIQVTVTGAGHVSFLDSISACGLFCNFCATPSVPQAQVLNVAHAYLVSFYERYLRNDTAYDTFLTGSAAQTLFVSTSQATIVSK